MAHWHRGTRTLVAMGPQGWRNKDQVCKLGFNEEKFQVGFLHYGCRCFQLKGGQGLQGTSVWNPLIVWISSLWPSLIVYYISFYKALPGFLRSETVLGQYNNFCGKFRWSDQIRSQCEGKYCSCGPPGDPSLVVGASREQGARVHAGTSYSWSRIQTWAAKAILLWNSK